MSNKLNYQNAKKQLLEFSRNVKRDLRGDIPAINQSLNDFTDSICRNGLLTERQKDLLHNYCCELHPDHQKEFKRAK